MHEPSGATFAWLPQGLPHRVELVLAPHTSLCVRRMDIVTVRRTGT